MDVCIATTDREIAACYPVLKELRQDLVEAEFVPKIRGLEKRGYMIAFMTVAGKPVSVAGFRLGESLAWKRYLYVDDLVTLNQERSKGYGTVMLNWLTTFARDKGCSTFHLDSGIQRKDAHRFYEREGMQMASYHFAKYVKLA